MHIYCRFTIHTRGKIELCTSTLIKLDRFRCDFQGIEWVYSRNIGLLLYRFCLLTPEVSKRTELCNK
jgi:hypothetical protein